MSVVMRVSLNKTVSGYCSYSCPKPIDILNISLVHSGVWDYLIPLRVLHAEA